MKYWNAENFCYCLLGSVTMTW